MPGFQNHLGINITSTRLQLVEINYSGEEFTLESIDEEYFSELLDLNGKETKILTLLQTAFNEIIMRKPIKSRLVSFTLPHECFLTVRLPYENSLIQSDLIEEFKWELRVLFPKLQSEELIVQFIKVDDLEKSSSNTAVVIATFRKYLKILTTFCIQNGLKLKYIDNAHFASDNIIALNDCCPADEYILSLYTGTNSLSFAVLYNNRPIYFNILPAKNSGEVIARINEELNENKHIKLSSEKISKVFIAGENISEMLLEKLKESSGLSPDKINPFEEISIHPGMFANKLFTERATNFTAAAGIAYRMV
ncbi:MAG: type IV pilus biogenesis protein PilM [Bacillota bacterium]